MSSKIARFLGVVVALSAASLFTLAQDEKAVGSINKQADQAAKKSWKELAKQGEELAKTHDIADVMQLFKTRKPAAGGGVDPKTSGVGIGKFGTYPMELDGIDARISKLSREPMPKPALEKEAADLLRMAEHTAAIASVSVHQCIVEKKMADMDPARWRELMEEMHKGSLDMIKAIKSQKPTELQAAAKVTRSTCTECHSTFRDK